MAHSKRQGEGDGKWGPSRECGRRKGLDDANTPKAVSNGNYIVLKCKDREFKCPNANSYLYQRNFKQGTSLKKSFLTVKIGITVSLHVQYLICYLFNKGFSLFKLYLKDIHICLFYRLPCPQ